MRQSSSKNQLIIEYLLSYFCRFNTLKGTAKALTVDLSRRNNLRRTIRKVMEEGGKKTKQKKSCKGGRLKKKLYKEEVKEKRPAELIALTCLQTVFAWEATWPPLYTAVFGNFLVLVEYPFTWFSLQLVKRTFSFQGKYIMCVYASSWRLSAKNPLRKTLAKIVIRKLKRAINRYPARFIFN